MMKYASSQTKKVYCMAKSKEQKKLEANFREVRGNLIDIYRQAESEPFYNIIKILLNKNIESFHETEISLFKKSGALDYLKKIEKYKKEYMSFPEYLQITGFDGWNLDEADDLKKFKIEIEKNYIINNVSVLSESEAIKLKKRI